MKLLDCFSCGVFFMFVGDVLFVHACSVIEHFDVALQVVCG